MASLNTFQTETQLEVGAKNYTIYSLKKLAENGHGKISKLPKSLKVLLENLLRYEDNNSVQKTDIEALINWVDAGKAQKEIAYRPARVLMQDFTGVPAVVDLAAMRDAMKNLGGDTKKINPLAQVDLVIDHSVSVDSFGSAESFEKNVELEFQRNKERYVFLKWGQNSFENFRVVPPGTGICHQVNLEYLAKTVWSREINGTTYAYPDTLVGTDSHTTMINGVSVLGWGVGGIEAEAAMLGQPISMLIPEVVGFELTGSMTEGTTATDLVLTVVTMLRKHGVVGKFVEFYGAGLDNLTLADRATLANMAPEYGATCGFFPIDQETLNYLELSGRSEENIALVEAYAKEQGLWRTPGEETTYTSTLGLDMSTVEASMAGPKRPQDHISLKTAHTEFQKLQKDNPSKTEEIDIPQMETQLNNGDVVIAAITSCTNTSNPAVMIGAGLVAQKARKLGLKVKPWVKTSFAPGSQVVTDYMVKSELQSDLDALGFNLVGYGCTTCIGNSGPLPDPIREAIDEGEMLVCSVLSGNRNFEGRVNPQTKGNYLASPPLVVAYALAGNMNIDMTNDPLGQSTDGKDVFLKDIWPTNKEIQDIMTQSISRKMFQKRYANVFEGPKEWQDIATSKGDTYAWDESTYIQNPPYFEGMGTDIAAQKDITNAKPLAILGDSVTTDHISPAGRIENDGPTEQYLKDQGVERVDFNSYGSRRGNHQVMMRGTFANIRLRNELAPGTEGGWTKYLPTGDVMSIFDAAQKYKADGTELVVIGGKEYGTGSSRDWAAKGTLLLGVRAVITESFERIHRSNLIGMGVLPLQFPKGVTRTTLNLDGTESYNITGLNALKPQSTVSCEIVRTDGSEESLELVCRLDTTNELEYYRHGGILQYVLRELL